MARTQSITIAKLTYSTESQTKAIIQRYLSDINTGLRPEGLDNRDLEIRFTELLAEKGIAGGGMITAEAAEAVIAQLGSPGDVTGKTPQQIKDDRQRQLLWRLGLIVAIIISVVGLIIMSLLLYAHYRNGHSYFEPHAHMVEQATSEVVIDNYEGDVTIKANANPSDTTITVERESRWATKRPHIEEKWNNNTLYLSSSSCPAFLLVSISVTCETDYILTVPRTMKVTIANGGGKVSIANIKGDITAKIDSGTIALDTITADMVDVRADAGTITARGLTVKNFVSEVSAGTITARLTTPPHRVKAKVASGSIDFELPKGTSYNVKGATASGERKIQVNQSSTSDHVIEVNTDSGSVVITQQ